MYVAKLDHVRALAAFLVYAWHMIHWQAAYDAVPAFPPLSLLEEGHAGVALFMTLSGYLFAKIIDGRPIDLARFYQNRALRLAPLLAVVLAYWAFRGKLTPETFLTGFVLPTWPNGTWSIAVELQFYLLFPAILALQTRNRIRPLVSIIAMMMALRTAGYVATGSIQGFAYWTIGGCLDLFVMGLLWHELAKRNDIRRNAGQILAAASLTIVAGWHVFNLAGGFYGTTTSPIWIVMTPLEGFLFGAVIVGYEHARLNLPPLASRALAKTGEVSYSIYLVHFIVYPTLAKWAAATGADMADAATAMLVACITFPAVVLVAIASYTLIERPFLALRTTYRDAPARPDNCPADPTATPKAAPVT
ncbi:MAG: acyltransferase [Hyphomicrobium sp.]|nr:acyltransferase [Hyphomicrobium sp.]